ncbi:UNVERIFIED_CONTAM: hypothetical protein HDU68_006693 [Siphonaria sp. JEL0065]|nr:hypothetical protein HDU68_006693 [Siphonaria sp. JEL0065]
MLVALLLTALTASARIEYSATANIAGLGDSSIQGTLTFKHDNLTGIAPNTVHGFHIHQYGDASSKNGLNMGGHFNPTNKPHGCPPAPVSQPSRREGVITLPTTNHIGDLGSITANAEGSATQTWVSSELNLFNASDIGFVLGRGVIVHALVDDCVTQPSGNSSSRLAQGVIAKTSHDAVSNLPDTSSLNAIAVFSGAVIPDPRRDSSVIMGTVTVSGALDFSFNLTGLAPSKTYTLKSYYTGDINRFYAYKCEDRLEATLIVHVTVDANGNVVEVLKSDFTGTAQQFFGLGFVIVDDFADKCPVAFAPVGIQFVAPPVPTTTTTTTTTTIDASVTYAASTTERNTVYTPPAAQSPTKAGNIYASSANSVAMFALPVLAFAMTLSRF